MIFAPEENVVDVEYFVNDIMYTVSFVYACKNTSLEINSCCGLMVTGM
jgi:hypothetical protein